MKIAIPIEENNGDQSPVSGHFGHAPAFAVAGKDCGLLKVLDSASMRQPDECAPLHALAAEGCSVILCRHMGQGALARCREEGMIVYTTSAASVSDALGEFSAGKCPQIGEGDLCHTGSTDCGHH